MVRERKVVQGGKLVPVRDDWKRGIERVRHKRSSTYTGRTRTLSDRSLSLSRQSSALAPTETLTKGVCYESFEPSFGNYYDPRYTHGSPQRSMMLAIALACIVKARRCVYVNKRRELPRENQKSQFDLIE